LSITSVTGMTDGTKAVPTDRRRALNLILLDPAELDADGSAVLVGERAKHMREVLRSEPGDAVRVGVKHGKVGEGRVVALGENRVELFVTLTDAPPPRCPVDLLLALPRPKVARRVLRAASQLGISRVILVNAARVDRSYFSSPILKPESIARSLDEGLEQAKDTVPPEIRIEKFFRPFVEDELPKLFDASYAKLLAHPGVPEDARVASDSGRAVLAIGPEGGWVPFELDLLKSIGFKAFSAGSRTLRSEVAVPLLVGQVELAMRGTR